MDVLDAVFIHPTVSGTYGIVPPQLNPTHPFLIGETICKTVSKGAVFDSGKARPNVMPLVPVHPE
jgi:hypothetical protein